MNDATLPSGWEITALENVCELVAGNPAPQGHQYFENGKFNFVRVQDMGRMGDSTYLSETKDKVNDQAISKLRLFPKGSVLFTKSGASTLNNQRAILGKDCYVVSHIAAALPKDGISSEWIYFSLVCVDFADLAHSSVMPSLPLSKVKSIPVVIPPTNEQHRIVVKIEELFSELDKGIENLKTAQAQLKVYRQALLKHAFEGKLTAQWRAQHRDQLETAATLQQRIQQERAQRYQQQLADWQANGGSKPKAPKSLPPLTTEELAELPQLPEGWAWSRLLDACEAVVDCHNKTAPYQAAGIPLIRTPSIRDMKLNFDDSIRYVSQVTYEYWSRRCPPLPGDILFTREAPMGEAALIPEGTMVCMGQRIMLLRPGKFLLGKYLLAATQNPIFKRVADKMAVGTGVKHLRVGDVERLFFPLCSVSEQNEISNLLDARLSEVDQLDQTLTTSLQQAEALRQSILKKAFSGQLVAQDVSDEPAALLLARIKEEKAAQAMAAKPKSRKAAAKTVPTKTNVIPFPARIPGISHSELHAGIMALAYRQHEQSRRTWYFGHVKAEKISHMVESFLGIDLDRKPIKDAAGPNDFKRLLAVESLAREQMWFDVQKQKSGRHVLYKMEGFDDLIERTSAALGEQLDSVKVLIGHFVVLNKTRSEIVATLYAAWNNLLLLGRIPSDEEIVVEATTNWHEDKLRIRRERFFNALEWMRAKGLVPSGKGRYVGAKAPPETTRTPS